MTRNSLPQNFIKTPYTLFDDFTSLTNWNTLSNAVVSSDTAYVQTGTKSMKIVTSAGTGGTSCTVDNLSINLPLSGVNSRFYLKVYIPDPTTISSLNFYIGSASSWSKYFNFNHSGVSLHWGWNYIAVYPSEGIFTGGFTFSDTLLRMRVTVVQATTAPATVYVDSIHYGGKSTPKIIITFDDGWKTVNDNALPTMNQLGLKGTMYTVPNFLSDSGVTGTGGASPSYCTKANLVDMQNNGWCIANHTMNHAYYTSESWSVDNYAQKVQQCRDWLNTNGFKGADHIAYPRGEYDLAIADKLRGIGMKTGRSTYTSSVANAPFVDDFFQLDVRGFGSTTTLSLAMKWVDYAIENGGYTFLMFHQIPIDDTVTNDGINQPSLAWSQSKFISLMTYLKERKVDCLTVDEWYNGLTNPRKKIV